MITKPILHLVTLALVALPAAAQTLPAPHASLKGEIERSIAKGISFLQSKQSADGSWSDATQPALTALPLRAVAGDPNRPQGEPVPPWAQKGYAFLLGTQKHDGGLYNKGLGTYNTSIGLMALLAANDSAYDAAARKARRFLINQQQDFDAKGKTDNPLDGGVGYGGTLAHSDLSNTHLALEALHYAKKRFSDDGAKDAIDLDWNAAIAFVSRCQNLPASNDQPWASNDAAERGGFVYTPVESKAGEKEVAPGRKTFRSYGSMSYAGLLSFLYAEVDAKDPRVVAAKEWLERNYNIKENPNMGAQGLYYYYHTMAKALAAAGRPTLKTAAGEVDWKNDLAVQILSLQKTDGSWVNEGSNRWMEDDPVLVTCYSLLALEQIYHSL